MRTLLALGSVTAVQPSNSLSYLEEHQRHSLRRSLSRSSRQWPHYSNIKERSSIWLQKTPSNGHNKDLGCLGNSMNKIALELAIHDCHISPESINSLERNYTSGSIKHNRVPQTKIYTGLNMMLLFGLFTLQGSQQAIAGTELANRMQPLAYFGDLGDISTGFASAFLLIFFSELGDKTFFIAALLAARNSGLVVFIGTFGALAFAGADLPVDDIAAVCLLVYFGVSTLLEASSGDGMKMNEEQKEAELAVSELSANGAGIMAAAGTVVSTFLLVFVAEWGDKSFFSTIALAAASSPLGVVGGALAGHALATLLAVIGGSLLGAYFSEKVIAYIGGTLFLIFAAVTLVEIVS